MPASTIDRPDTGIDAGVTDDPPDGATSPPFDGEEEGHVSRDSDSFNWRRLGMAILVITIAVVTAFITYLVMEYRSEEQIREERKVNALRDLNNRISTEELDGSFTRVFYVGKEMRAEWVREDGLKRCNMRVNPPTDEVLRYSTTDVEADDASFRMFRDSDAIGCLEATAGGGIGGG